MLAEITNNPDWAFVLCLVGLILGVIVLIQSGLQSLVGWGLVALGLAGVLFWWP